MRLSIIIPVFNEEKTIEEILNRVIKVSLPMEKEIIVVNDASLDNTQKTLIELKKQFNFVLIEHKINQGKGAAIKNGLSVVSGDFVLIQDADLEYDPRDYPALLEPLIKGQADVVYGSRILRKNPHSSELYFLGGQFLTRFFNIIFKTHLTDINTGYKVFKKGILEKLDLKEKRFAFCEEVTSKAVKKGYKITERPINYSPRSFKEGKKIRWWKDGFRSLFAIIKYRVMN